MTSQPVSGHLHPNLALARALRRRGHEVVLYSGERARAAAEREGLAFAPFQPSMDARLSELLVPADGVSPASQLATDTTGVLRVRRFAETLRRWLLDTVPEQVADLRALVETHRPDVLVDDPTLLGPILVLKDTLPVPVAVFSVLAACNVPGPDAPPWGRGLPPPRTPWTKLRAGAERVASDWLTAGVRGAANDLRARYGLPPLAGRLAEEYARVALMLVTSTPALDYERRDLPPSVRYVGACVWDGGAMADAPGWIAELRRDQPVVHVTEGTIQTRAPLVLRAAAAGLSGRPLQVVMTTGRHRRAGDLDLGPLGPNVRIEQFVPHHHLFPRTDVVVTTGGAGTVTTALLNGVPLVVVPTQWDLPENAQRIVEAGAGLRLDPGRCTPARLRRAVERVLETPRFRENARRLGAALTREGGAARAVELLEELTAAGRPAAVATGRVS